MLVFWRLHSSIIRHCERKRFSTSWSIYQYKGAPTSDCKTEVNYYETADNSHSYIRCDRYNLAHDANCVYYLDSSFSGDLTFAGESDYKTTKPGIMGRDDYAMIWMDLNASSDTNTASGYFYM